MDEKVFPVEPLKDDEQTRDHLRLMRDGLEIPNENFRRAMAMEILRLWGDPDWNKY